MALSAMLDGQPEANLAADSHGGKNIVCAVSVAARGHGAIQNAKETLPP
jgi:hypothetical protein